MIRPLSSFQPTFVAVVTIVCGAIIASDAAFADGPSLQISAPFRVNENGDTDSASDGAPVIVASGNTVIAFWGSNRLPNGSPGNETDVYFRRSTNQGATWSPTAALNNDFATDTKFDGDVIATTDGAGNWVAVWSGTGPGNDDDLFIARSADDGVTWTSPALLNHNAATDSAHDQDPSIATDGNGVWVVVWRGNGTDLPQPGFSDTIVSRSTDNGVNWATAHRIDLGVSADVGNDLNPRIVTDRSGTWMVVWAGEFPPGPEFDILFARSVDGGINWTAPAPVNSYAGSDNSPDFAPTLATDGSGTWVVAWQSPAVPPSGQIGSESDILFARSTDAGATWSTAARVSTNGASDAGVDESPSLAIDAFGDCLLVWQSNGRLPNGDFGDDRDVLVVSSTDHCLTWTDPGYVNTYAATDQDADDAPVAAYLKPGRALVVWQSPNTPTGTSSDDSDILAAVIVQENAVPALGPLGIVALSVCLIAAGWSVLGRIRGN